MTALVIFTADVPRLAKFYEQVLDASPTVEASGDVRLINDHCEVVVHSVPRAGAARVATATPQSPRSNTSLKPVFEVTSLTDALARVAQQGGALTKRTFSIDGVTRHDVVDPDGNVIQLRA